MDLHALQVKSPQATEINLKQKKDTEEPFWGNDGFTFGDVLDMVNPLQHIPIISDHYREQSQDEACEGARLIGGMLLGGLVGGISGVLSSLANSAVRHETKQDTSEHLITITERWLNDNQAQEQSIPSEVKQSTLNASHRSFNSVSESNPFFAQLFESMPSESVFHNTAENVSDSRISVSRVRDWGKV